MMILNSNNDNTDESNTPMRYRIQILNHKITLYSGQADDFTGTTYLELWAIWSTATNNYMAEYHQTLLLEGIDTNAQTSDVINVVVGVKSLIFKLRLILVSIPTYRISRT